MSEKTGRVQPLDFLRGIAIAGVIAFHLSLFFGRPGGIEKSVSAFGFLGVQLFFLVSALTMCTMWDQREGESRQTIKFYIRRVARIAGPFWLAMIFYLLLDSSSANFWGSPDMTASQVLRTAVFGQTLWPDTINLVVPGDWSIGVEMLFYLFFPLLIRLRGSVNFYLGAGFTVYLANIFLIRPLYQTLIPALVVHDINDFLYYQLFNQAPIFLIGIALYKLLKGQKLDGASGVIVAVWLATSFILRYRFDLHGSPFFWLPIFVVAASVYGTLKFEVSIKPVNLLGKISYSVYLFHFAVIGLVRILFERAGVSTDATTAFVLAFSLVVAGSSLIAYLMRKFVEVPSSGIGRLLVKAV